MKKRLFAALLCALLIAAAIPGSAWSAPDPGSGGEQTVDPGTGAETDPGSETDPAPTEHFHSEHLFYVPANRPTCTSEGNSAYFICDCGQWFSDAAATQPIADHSSVILPRAEHTPEVFLGTPATCSETGVTAGFRCAVCGAVLEGMYVIPKIDHTPSGDWSSSSEGHWHACTVCGEQLDFAAHVSDGPATATRPEVCSVCGFVIRHATGSSSTTPGGTVRPTPRPTPTPTPTQGPTPTPEPGEPLVARVSFRDTGDTQMDDLVEEQPDEQTAVCTLQLPFQRPVSPGWYFEGWRCSADGALYQPGDELSFRYADTSQVDMTAEWTVLIGRGNYDLSAGMRYRFEEGSFLIDGDTTVYYGGSAFYVREGGNFTIR